MQSGAGARPEYANKRLVAVKRMKKKWEGGWDECARLKEIEVSLFCWFILHRLVRTNAPGAPCDYHTSEHHSAL